MNNFNDSNKSRKFSTYLSKFVKSRMDKYNDNILNINKKQELLNKTLQLKIFKS